MRDYIVRALSADAQICAFACTTREMVETARQIHNTSPVITAALGRLLSAGAMMGSMLKGERDLLTLQVKGDGPARGLLVTADARGNVKGYPEAADVILPANSRGKLDVGGAVGQGNLRVIKDMGLKAPYVGQVLLQTGEIAEDLTYYFAVSEQIPSSVGLGVLMNRDNTVRQAGGFIVQLMPFAGEETVCRLEENLAHIPSVTAMLDGGRTPEQILEILLDGLAPKMEETMSTAFFCGCDRHSMERVLISLGKREIMEMIEEGQEIEVCCQFCGTKHQFSVDALKELYQKSR